MTDHTVPVRPALGDRIREWLDRRINPVLLRDLRLYMRGRLMLAVYFLVLAALFMLAVLYTVIARFDGADGTGLLSILTFLLAIICGALIPNLVFERFRGELANRATELALTSPLTPARLVRGKLLGSWCMTLMVVSASSPILATAYLLGGINILSLLGVVGGVVLAGLVLPMAQLYLAADIRGGKGTSRVIAALLFVLELILMIGYSSLLTSAFLGTGYREPSLVLLLCLAVAAILIAQFLYFTCVGTLQGEAENREIAPRLSLSAAVVLGVTVAVLMYRSFDDDLAFLIPSWWEFATLLLCLVSYVFCVGFTGLCTVTPWLPRNLLAAWRGLRLRAMFFLPGIRSLSSYVLLT
ncbi:MAG: hypothetical protein LIP77_08710, partial [Planctomycetes bacterium]|nr:hypothetical protein [Planctomycetota bacterium]